MYGCASDVVASSCDPDLDLDMLGLSLEGTQASLNELEPCGDAASSASSPEIGESAGCS